MTTRGRHRMLGLLAAVFTALALPLSAAAADDEVRRVGTCTRSSEVTLRLRADDGDIDIELEVETSRRGTRWAVILLHERRIAFRGTLRARSGGRVRLRRTVADLFGSDAVVARATGPRAETCRVGATL